MLIKSTTGKVLTDTQGRTMTTKDRWHPLVVDYAQRVVADGGKIETPALEEMNTMAWNGDFDDALFAFFACGRKEGKLYSLIGDDLIVERDSAATRWNKYGILEEIGEDVPVINFNPSNKEIKGLLREGQNTNLYNYSDPNAAEATGQLQNAVIEPNDWGIGLKNKAVMDNQNATVDCNYFISLFSTYPINTEFYISFFVKNLSSQTITPGVDFKAQLSGGNSLNTSENYDYVKIKERVFLVWTKVPMSRESSQIINVGVRKRTAESPGVIEVSGMMCFEDKEVGKAMYIPTNNGLTTRLADDISSIPVPEGTTEIHTEIDGIQNIQTEDLPENWEFPTGSITKYVIMK